MQAHVFLQEGGRRGLDVYTEEKAMWTWSREKFKVSALIEDWSDVATAK